MSRGDDLRDVRASALLELSVTIGVVTLTVLLILPSLYHARGAARRIQCVNCLKQLGLALENYQACYSTLPPGALSLADRIDAPSSSRIGWIVQVLPFLEQQPVWDVINTQVPWDEPQNRTASVVHLNILNCPADPAAAGSMAGVSSFVGCHDDRDVPIGPSDHGVLFLNSTIMHEDVLDGMSETIYLGEKRYQPLEDGWMSGGRANLRNVGVLLNATVEGFGSHHPGGANFAFGDGSVRWLGNSINPHIYRSLGNRSDGEMIEPAW